MAKNFKTLRDELDARPNAAERAAHHRAATLEQFGLYQLRLEREFTQVELAELLDIAQTGVSRIENAADVRVSTLTSYLAALGAELRLEAVFADGTSYPINLHAKHAPARL